MKFVIVGCGYISRVHLAAIQKVKGAYAVALVDKNLEVAKQRAEEFHVPRVYSDWKEAFAGGNAEAVVICLPHGLHFPCVVDALNSGKHVLLEKPISCTVAEGLEMTRLAREKNLTLMVAHMKRFDRRFEAIKQEIDKGSIGELFLVKSEWIGPREVFVGNPWLASKALGGGGPLMGFGSHHIDLMQWLAGPIQDINCYQNNRVWPDIEVEDTAVVIMRFLHKAIGCAIYTWGARIDGQSENFSVYGTGGSLVLQNEELYHISEKTYQDRQPRRLDIQRSDRQDIETFGKEIAISSLEPFVRQLQEFINCVQTHQKPPVDGAAATATVEKILQAYHIASVK